MTLEEQLSKIKRGTVEIISEEELITKLKSGRPLRVKLGVDPTSPDIHLGHTVVIEKLKTFQDLGHHVVFIIGDFTAKIGDPSGRSATRPTLGEEEILNNAKTYQEQVFKILDKEKTEVMFNSHWLYSLGLDGLLELAKHSTVAQMLARADFNQRYKEGNDITILEFLYPLLTSYDSVAVKSDVELGGTDQKFNLLMARKIQKDYGEPSQVAITMPILEGTDGIQKMSKSYGNYIGISEHPSEIFGKIMSISDELMYKYYLLITNENLDEIKKEHPKKMKQKLANIILTKFYSKNIAEQSEQEFEKVFSAKELPSNIEEFRISEKEMKLSELLVKSKLVTSKKEAERMIQQGGVKINEQKVSDDKVIKIENSILIQVGKRKFKKIIT
ncbi:MAG: tyrosine--tRNA ligase [Elusimicrobia bacterium RIFOXYC2_FULL_34_12]|nr:MAG: tyrosine--tRNA ligase [Elusimicrobia bacterium RIFOXYC2_FULL_34_12]OGS38530.1 MAG: tyrosine--tRNA ligase [Elusimicrobia bacterium RIFOXYD2_FULL_34_30]HAM38089.1 tyrosine--tRNA ligase [Elusimicrobiota bacterium]